jgi:hypothetical protein
MSRRLAVVAAIVAGSLSPWSVRQALAQDAAADPDASSVMITAATPAVLRALQPMDLQPAMPPQRQPLVGGFKRPMVMGSLYVSTAMLQALDVHSTLKGLSRGATEANPVMSGVTSNKAAFIAAKAGVAAATILAARQIAKKNKLAAALTLIGINSVYAAVVSHNYKVASSLR